MTPSVFFGTTPKVEIMISLQNPMFYIAEDEGKVVLSKLDWTSLYYKSGAGIYAKVFGEGKEANPELVFLYDTVDGVNKLADYSNGDGKSVWGIYAGCTGLTADDDGELCYKVRIISYEGAKEYNVTKTLLDQMEAETGGAAIIKFASDIMQSENDIKYNSMLRSLGTNHNEWITDDSFKQGTVEKIAGNRIYFTDGSAYYFDSNSHYHVIGSVVEGAASNRFRSFKFENLRVGDQIYYLVDTVGTVRAVIVVE